MAIYFPNQVPSTGQKAGEAFSGGIGNALGMLAQQKLAHVQQRHQATQLGHALESLGIPGQVAMLPESVQQAFIKQHLAAPQQQAFAEALSGLLGGEQQQQAAPEQQGQQIAPQLQQAMGQQPQQIQQQSGIQQPKLPGTTIPKGLNQQQASQLAQLGLQKQKMSAAETKEEKKHLHELERAERPYYQKVLDNYESSHRDMTDLKRLESLINKGKIVNPTEDHMQRYLSSVFKINLKDLRGADTEEFEKIVAGFVKNAKQWFGSRVTNFDLQSFLKTLPTLATSHEGKMRLIGSMKAAADAQQSRYKALKELMKENGGHLPPYAQLKVEERIKPLLDKYAEEFAAGTTATPLSPEAESGSNRGWWIRPVKAGITGARALGSTIQGVGNVLGGLAKSIF